MSVAATFAQTRSNAPPASASAARAATQAHSSSSSGAMQNVATPAVRLGAGGGQPMPGSVRLPIERSLGEDLSHVRVHQDKTTATAVDSMGARAFAYGSGIYLGSRESANDLRLMAHESAHVIQQRGGASPLAKRHGGGSGMLEAEADCAASAVGRSERMAVTGRTGLRPQFSLKDELGNIVSGVLDFGESVGWKLLDRFAPELTPVIRQGPLEWIKEKASNALESAFNTIMAPVRTVSGVGQRLSAQFTPMLAWLQDAAVKISKNDCQPLRDAAAKIEQTATHLIQPIVETLQPVIAKIQSFFSGLWEKFGSPAWDWVKKVAGEQWAQIERLASWIWGKTEPIRKATSKAWTWLKNKIGIGEGPEGQNGILQWVQAKLATAWQWLQAKLEPYKKELAIIAGIVGGIALMLSPAGPVIAIGGLVYGVIQAVRWIKANWGRGVVQARVYVEKTLIPGLLSAANKLTAKVTSVAASIASAISGLSVGLGRLVGAAASTALRFLVSAAQWVTDQINNLAVWARDKLNDLARWLGMALERLLAFGRQIMSFLAAVGKVVLDVYAIQGKILKKLWDLVPACIRDPVVDFLIPLIIRQVELFRELVADNEAWQKTKKEVMNILQLVFEKHDLKGALTAVFYLILRVFNIPPELLTTIKQKALSAWDTVSKKPLAFIKNLLRSVGHGFSLLWKNLKSHLIYGLEGWLLGPLAEKGITPPASWTDPMAVLGLALDVMGLSVEHIFELMKKRFDPAKVELIRKAYGHVRSAWNWVTSVIDTSKSPAENTKGIIDRVKDFAMTVFTGIAEWIAGKVAVELAAYAAAAAASAGVSAVLDAFRRIYKALLTAKRWMRQILDMISQALDNVLAVANGAIEVAGEKFEGLLHRAMPMVISFLGDQVGLGGIHIQISETVRKLRQKVDEAILWLIDKIKAGLDAIVSGLKAAGKALLRWWKAKEPIPSEDGRQHNIYFEGDENNPTLKVASSPMDAAAAIDLMEKNQATVKQISEAKGYKKTIDDAVKKLVAKNKQLGVDATPGNKAAAESEISTQHSIMRGAMRDLATLLGKTIFGQVKYSDLEETVITPSSGSGQATTIEAAPLTAKRDMGTEPTVSPPGWDAIVAEGLTNRDPSYVRLHLINQNFGGRGDYTRNLVPGSKQNNSDHLRTAENQLKDLIGSAPRDSSKRAQIWYKADVAYRSDNEATWKKAKYKHIKTSDFARSIRFTWGFYKFVPGKKWEKDNKIIGDLTLGPIPLPDL